MMKEYRRIVVDNEYYYGKHLIASLKRCNENVLSKEYLASFLRRLTKKIDMIAFGEPLVERFGQGIEIGISGVQLIETSAITIHTNDGARDLYLDIFSCKDFNPQTALDYVHECFAPEYEEHEVLLRK